MRVRYTDTALAEIQEIFSYIEAGSPRAAAAVVAGIAHTIEVIGDLPEIGTLKYRQIVRMQPVRRYPQYLVFYAIEADEVVILNVRHGARRRPWEDDSR
jgi:plasmid stabilization system protein ParE